MRDQANRGVYARLLLPSEPRMRVLSHLIFWLIFIGYHMIFFLPIMPDRVYSPETRLAYLLYYARFIPIYYGVVLLVGLSGHPFQRWFSPLITLFACILITHILTKPLYHFYDKHIGIANLPGNFQLIGKYYLKGWIPAVDRDWYVFVYDLMDMQLLALPIGLKYIRLGAMADRSRAALEKEHIQDELKELRAQLAPHFILNVLNAASSEVGTFSQKASEYLAHAADMIRFALHDTRSEFIELNKELEFIARYLRLEAMRTSQRSKIDFESTGETKTAKRVPTLMLTTLIENAFKHGVHSTHGPSYVKISCHIEADRVTLQVLNSKPLLKAPQHSKSIQSGLGLSNLRRRLEAHFPDRYHLRVTEQSESFLVYLQIPLTP